MGGGTFTIATDPSNDMARGTEVTLHLRDDAAEYATEKSIKDLVKRHSEFIGFPISLYVTKEEEKEVEVSDDEDEEEADADKDKDEDADAEDKPKKDGDDDDDVQVEEVDEEEFNKKI